MSFLVQFVVAVLRALLPALLTRAQPTAEDARRRPELRARLRARVRATWGSKASAVLLAAALLLGPLLAGCGARTVYIPPGEPVRLRETVYGAKVWVVGEDGKPVAGRVDLREGWYVLPDYDPDEDRTVAPAAP